MQLQQPMRLQEFNKSNSADQKANKNNERTEIEFKKIMIKWRNNPSAKCKGRSNIIKKWVINRFAKKVK